MTEIRFINRKSSVLTTSSIACLSEIPTINLTAGCAHECLFCYGRGYRSFPGEGKIEIYANTLDQLKQELPRKRKKPVAVYFSPSSDLYQPINEVLDLGYEVLSFLLENSVGVSFLTKGAIPQRHLELLARYPMLVRAQIDITTLNEELQSLFEPQAAPPTIRLQQAKSLIKSGIATTMRLDPILPGLTDNQATFDALLEKINETGVKEVAASTLFLRSPIIGTLKRHIHDQNILIPLLSHYSQDCQLDIQAQAGSKSTLNALPSEYRKAIFFRLNEAAAKYGITVKICACKNSDIASGTCNIAGNWK